jgi:transcriptional regulator of arginine metabolism
MYYYTDEMNDISKIQRHQLLKRVINEQEIRDQTQLLDELKKRNITSTQATISRDLQELGVIKSRIKPGIFKYEISGKESEDILWNKLKVLFKNFVYDVKSTQNMMLIKTSPGNANGVAEIIDRLEFKEILGTLAGDDTILVVVDNEKNRRKVEEELNSLIERTRKK